MLLRRPPCINGDPPAVQRVRCLLLPRILASRVHFAQYFRSFVVANVFAILSCGGCSSLWAGRLRGIPSVIGDNTACFIHSKSDLNPTNRLQLKFLVKNVLPGRHRLRCVSRDTRGTSILSRKATGCNMTKAGHSSAADNSEHSRYDW